MSGLPDLDPELKAEDWYATGERAILWCHEASAQCVTVTEFHGGRSLVPDAGGFMVGLDRRNKGGEPVAGGQVWVKRYEETVRQARALRRLVVDGLKASDAVIGRPTFAEALRLASRPAAEEVPSC